MPNSKQGKCFHGYFFICYVFLTVLFKSQKQLVYIAIKNVICEIHFREDKDS